MAPIYKHRRPSAGRYGTHPVFFTYQCGANPFTANQTVTLYVAAPGRKMVFSSLSATSVTVGSDADGTLLARARKVVAGTATTMSADLDVEAITTKVVSRVGQLSTATDANLFIGAADSLVIDIVNNSAAIDTQPTNLTFTIECFLVE